MDAGILWILGAIAAGAVVLGLMLAAPPGVHLIEPSPHGELGSPAEVALAGLPHGARVEVRLRDELGRILGEAALEFRGSRAEGFLYFDLSSTPTGTLEVLSPDGRVLLRRPVRFRDERGEWVKVFFFDREGKPFPAVRRIPGTPRVATEALRALFSGPTPMEEGAGIWTAVPAGAKLRSIAVSGGAAEVIVAVPDPGAPALELFSVQVRETLLQFPTIARVEIRFVPR